MGNHRKSESECYACHEELGTNWRQCEECADFVTWLDELDCARSHETDDDTARDAWNASRGVR